MPHTQAVIAPSAFTNFGELLKYLRRRAQLTQQDLATQVGYTHAQISRLERDRSRLQDEKHGRPQPQTGLHGKAEGEIENREQGEGGHGENEQARQFWSEQTSRQSVKASTLANAGFFFKLPDKPLAASMYGRLEELEPGNAQWNMLRSRVLAYAIIGLAAINQNGFALAVDPAEAGSEFAKKVRSDLEATNDVTLLMDVSAVLNTQGVMVARDRSASRLQHSGRADRPEQA